MTPAQYIQQLELPNQVQLFHIVYNNSSYYLTNSSRTDAIFWDNNQYIAFPISISGLKYTETNTSEKPKITLSNVGLHFNEVFAVIPSLKGAKLTFIETFEPYIGTTSGNDTSLYLIKRHLTFDQLISKTPSQIVYEMGTLSSWTKKVFPVRQMLRDGLPKLRFEGLGINKSA